MPLDPQDGTRDYDEERADAAYRDGYHTGKMHSQPDPWRQDEIDSAKEAEQQEREDAAYNRGRLDALREVRARFQAFFVNEDIFDEVIDADRAEKRKQEAKHPAFPAPAPTTEVSFPSRPPKDGAKRILRKREPWDPNRPDLIPGGDDFA